MKAGQVCAPSLTSGPQGTCSLCPGPWRVDSYPCEAGRQNIRGGLSEGDLEKEWGVVSGKSRTRSGKGQVQRTGRGKTRDTSGHTRQLGLRLLGHGSH